MAKVIAARVDLRDIVEVFLWLRQGSTETLGLDVVVFDLCSLDVLLIVADCVFKPFLLLW